MKNDDDEWLKLYVRIALIFTLLMVFAHGAATRFGEKPLPPVGETLFGVVIGGFLILWSIYVIRQVSKK